MTPGAVRALRAWFQFDRYLDPDEPEQLFVALMNVAKWRVEQGLGGTRDLDGLVSTPMSDSAPRFGLVMHLATIDTVFFELARRMMARHLVREAKPDELTRHLAAALLDPGEIPKSDKPKLARDVAVVLALCVGKAAGWPPTQNREKAGDGIPSGTARALVFLPALRHSGIERIWTEREARLLKAGFDQTAVSDFLDRISRTTRPD